MRRASPCLGALAIAGLSVTLAARDAAAFCRSSVCPDGSEGKVCTPAESDDCGIPLAWPTPCTSFSVQESASKQIDRATAESILKASLAAWTSASCGTYQPTIQVLDFGTVSCDSIEYNEHAGNANVLLFRDDKWPYSGDDTTDTIALTTVTYDTGSGQIYDADIEVNSANFVFSTDVPASQTDLQAVLTHEAGHFLGMAHDTINATATMYPSYQGVDMRTLAPSDIDGICAAYPPGRGAEGACTGEPRHGFAPECANDQTEQNCSFAPSPEPFDRAPLACCVALAAVVIASRRRRATAG